MHLVTLDLERAFCFPSRWLGTIVITHKYLAVKRHLCLLKGIKLSVSRAVPKVTRWIAVAGLCRASVEPKIGVVGDEGGVVPVDNSSPICFCMPYTCFNVHWLIWICHSSILVVLEHSYWDVIDHKSTTTYVNEDIYNTINPNYQSL